MPALVEFLHERSGRDTSVIRRAIVEGRVRINGTTINDPATHLSANNCSVEYAGKTYFFSGPVEIIFATEKGTIRVTGFNTFTEANDFALAIDPDKFDFNTVEVRIASPEPVSAHS